MTRGIGTRIAAVAFAAALLLLGLLWQTTLAALAVSPEYLARNSKRYPHVRFVTGEYRYDRAYWVRLVAMQDSRAPAGITRRSSGSS